MRKKTNFSVVFYLLAMILLSLSMAVKDWITWAPTIGGILSLFFLVAALISELKRKSTNKDDSIK